MNESGNLKTVSVKILAIVGFFATLVLIVWLVVFGIKQVPSVFTSLASIAESIRDYRPVDELSIATEKSVVNSNESFQISWTDLRREGEYTFSYVCTQGVQLEVRGGDGTLIPIACTDILTLPGNVHGIFLSISSDEARFADIPLKVSFKNATDGALLASETKVTVVNAIIPTQEQTPVVVVAPIPVVTPAPVPTPEPTPSVKPVVPAQPKPVYTTIYPQSNPNGFVDLRVTTISSGVLTNGVYTATAKYDDDLRNAIKFDIKNIGTKTSDTWTFKTILPSGETYESPVQIALKPQEHVEFTLGFELGDDSDKLVKITNTVYTKTDANSKNNSATWYVTVTE